MAEITYKATPTFRELIGRFLRGNSDLSDDLIEWGRIESRRLESIAQRRAPKRSGKFSAGIRSGTSVGNNAVTIKLVTPQPLGKWIIGGTKPHVITGRPYLAFFWERIGRRVVVRSVNHPGTKANPFIRDSYDEWIPGAAMTFNRISTRWQATVAG